MANKLGIPFRIFYQSKEFRSGLTDVYCAVLKPDLSPLPILQMAEVSQPGFTGLYSVELLTLCDDPEGQYVARVFSATDGLMDDLRISFERSAAVSVSVGVENLTAEIRRLRSIIGALQPRDRVIAEIGKRSRREVY